MKRIMATLSAALPSPSVFKPVETIGRTLPDVEVATSWGKPALKVRGRMFVCIASHKSTEPDTLVVMMDFADRDALIEEDPDTYYLKEHYISYPCVLVRLAHVHADALRDSSSAGLTGTPCEGDFAAIDEAPVISSAACSARSGRHHDLAFMRGHSRRAFALLFVSRLHADGKPQRDSMNCLP